MRDNRRASSVAASQKQAATQLTPQQCVDLSARNTRHGLENVKADLIASRIEALKSDLPHLHGLKMYTWQRRFFESRNKMNLLCAANQIGKSTIAIRKNIEWAGNPELWPDLWKTSPKIFWYFYPSNEVATVEFEKKWVPDYLPRGTMKAHRTYGWNVEYSNGTLNAVHFNSGVSIFFKSYGQKIVNLQTATVHMITSDEEMPESYVDEILSRLRGTGGYFNQVFTATCGYPLWYRAMECIGGPEEAFRTAFKQVISLYDCKVYEDGTPSSWTDARIAEAEASCTSKREVLKRIHGRFVKDEGLRYEAFDYDRNVTPAVEIPRDWKFYTGVDIGSGGRGRSSGAIIFLAVSPDFSRARVIRSWRGDNVETTASDILAKYRAMRGKLPISRAAYDYASREFGLIASRLGESFERADKTKSSGEATVNTLLKSGALTIDMQIGRAHV